MKNGRPPSWNSLTIIRERDHPLNIKHAHNCVTVCYVLPGTLEKRHGVKPGVM